MITLINITQEKHQPLSEPIESYSSEGNILAIRFNVLTTQLSRVHIVHDKKAIIQLATAANDGTAVLSLNPI